MRPSHAHSIFSATVVLMVSTFLSRIIGLVRVKYIVWLFGRGVEADALNAAFVLPDMISYFLVGGAASITFVTILTRYREAGREAEAERSLSVILTTMYLVLGTAIVLAEVFAPWYVRWWFNGFDPQKVGALRDAHAHSAARAVVLLCRRRLRRRAGGAQAVQRAGGRAAHLRPGHHRWRPCCSSSAWASHRWPSAPSREPSAARFCLNWFFAHRAGTRYRMILDWHDKGLREWVRLSLPLMAGVSLVTADNWIIAHFASSIGGAVSLLSYAKQVFTAPMSMLAQAAGAASMPFFASLWTRDRRYEFATGVADSVSRVASLGLLSASIMMALGWPAIDLVFTGGRFSPADARLCSIYFAVFSVSMFLWSAQAIYARAFYAAGNTFVPMVASTVVTVVSLPIYASLFHWRGATGLALASDIGIALQTLTIAVAPAQAPHGLARQPRLRRDGPLPAGCVCGWRGRLAARLGLRRRLAPSARHGAASSRPLLDRRGHPHRRSSRSGLRSRSGSSKNPARPCRESPCAASDSAEATPGPSPHGSGPASIPNNGRRKDTSAPAQAEAPVLSEIRAHQC